MKKRIVLIVGAGASNDLSCKFPLGEGLLNDILNRVTDITSPNAHYLSTLLDKLGYDYSIRNEFVNRLALYKDEVSNPSIDGFIDEVSSYPEFETVKDKYLDIAQFAILFHILGYENELRKELPKHTWVDEIARFIDENKLFEETSKYDLKIITFNYDRNIEHILYNHERFVNCKEAIKRYINSSINHIYGKIGNLEWENGDDYFEFGERNDQWKKIYNKRKYIKLMYMDRYQEKIDYNIGANWIHFGEIETATEIVATFGFSWDLLNYRLLSLQTLERFVNDGIRIIANIYPNNNDYKYRRTMAAKIRNVKHNAEIRYLSCVEFLQKVF